MNIDVSFRRKLFSIGSYGALAGIIVAAQPLATEDPRRFFVIMALTIALFGLSKMQGVYQACEIWQQMFGLGKDGK